MAASLMGAVDTAVVGHLGNYTYINAVSLGAVIFSTVYWLFGFLKISTSGFAAQAMGHHDPKLLAGSFLRGGAERWQSGGDAGGCRDKKPNHKLHI